MMNPKSGEFDEEKSFEVIQENAPTTQFAEPHLVRRGLTEVSAMFDRNGKGYLDDTERALRRMDSADRGYLGIDKVCVIFESLQAEQERSSQLLEALRTESKKSLNLKMGVIALTIFSIVLALANVGTSFAVATLVKDMQVGDSGDLLVIGGNGERVATTAKLVTIDMDAIDDTRRRRLQLKTQFICDQMASLNDEGMTEKTCFLQGTMKMGMAEALYQNLRSTEMVNLNCNKKVSSIYGSYMLQGTPGPVLMSGENFRVYPDSRDLDNNKYDAKQKTSECTVQFKLAMYCPTALFEGQLQDCFVMSAYQPTDACPTGPVVCGPPPEIEGGIDY